MYSVMSMRIRLFSSSNRFWARALASSVLPTPVGPRKRKEPMGRFSSETPARERRMASATACTASSWPTTRSCSSSGRRRSFSRSVSISLETGMPVHRATILAISSSVTLSRSRTLSGFSDFSASSSSFCSLGRVPYLSSAARFRSYLRSAAAMSALVFSISSRSFCTLPMSVFSFSQRAFMALKVSRSWESCSRSRDRRSWLTSSFSFCRAASSISSCMIFRLTSSSSAGMESISVRIMAQASSTRSMALSGRKRSEI